jgi:hypothetical protein
MGLLETRISHAKKDRRRNQETQLGSWSKAPPFYISGVTSFTRCQSVTPHLIVHPPSSNKAVGTPTTEHHYRERASLCGGLRKVGEAGAAKRQDKRRHSLCGGKKMRNGANAVDFLDEAKKTWGIPQTL